MLDYLHIKEQTQKCDEVFLDKDAKCILTSVQYMTEFIRKNDKFGVSKRFCDAFKGLPGKWDPGEYYKFLDEWGTVRDCTFNNIS